jgi:hypothetical protein
VDELARALVDGPERRCETFHVLDVPEGACRELAPGDSVTDRPLAGSAVEEPRPFNAGKGGVEPVADGDHIRPCALPVDALDEVPGTPAVMQPVEPRHPEAVGDERAQQADLPLQLFDRGVERLQDELTAAPRRSPTAGEGHRLRIHAERREHRLRRPH